MTQKTRMVAASSLVEDLDLYPRETVDSTHVSHIAEAIAAGVDLPSIVADRKSKRVIDGIHRRRAYLRLDKEAVVPVIFKDYKNEAQMFYEAMSLNANHGRNLSANDRARCAMLASQHGIGSTETAQALNVRIETVERMVEELVVNIRGSSEKTVLRFPVRDFMKGKTLTKSQAKAMKGLGGNRPAFFANQLITLISENMLDWDDENLRLRLLELHALIDSKLKQLAA